ncbi:MAG: hypothetical protein L0Z73_18070 [Gammaproteobacteria bacterium]|nr:hypothetical protein [Gammaproteobacteria bacterium]
MKKKSAIPNQLAPILQQCNINEAQRLANTRYFGLRFYKVAGAVEAVCPNSHALRQS